MTDQTPARPEPSDKPARERADLPDDLGPDLDPGFGPEFGLEPPAHLDVAGPPGSEWIPDQVQVPAPATGSSTAHPPAADSSSDGPDGESPPDGAAGGRGPEPRAVAGRRLRGWVVAVVLAVVFVPLFVWFATSLADDAPDTDLPAPQSASRSVTAAATPVTPSATRVPSSPPRRPSGAGTAARPGGGGAITAPPQLTAVPPDRLVPVKPGAKVMRFEAHGPKGQLLEVALTDAQHQRFEYPVQQGPLGFELPVRATSSSSDYFSIRVRAPASSDKDTRVDVMCRIYVDDVLVTSQQGQGFATCYISPYYDVRRT